MTSVTLSRCIRFVSLVHDCSSRNHLLRSAGHATLDTGGWLARPTGTFTLQDASSFACRDNAKDKRTGSRALNRDEQCKRGAADMSAGAPGCICAPVHVNCRQKTPSARFLPHCWLGSLTDLAKTACGDKFGKPSAAMRITDYSRSTAKIAPNE